MRTANRVDFALALVGALIAGCGASPSMSGQTPPVAASTETSSPLPTATASPKPSLAARTFAPTLAPTDPLVGTLVATVSDRLRVRSEPRVSDDSIKYEPVLPLGTLLTVLDGPAFGSGYTWYLVAVGTAVKLNGPDYGWVAMASKEGEPWFAPLPQPALEYAGTDADYVGSDGQPYTRHLLRVANWASYPGDLFALSPDLPACGANSNASRTWVWIDDAVTQQRIYGFCGIVAPRELVDLWFAVLDDAEPPPAVYVSLVERRLGFIFRSNEVVIPSAEPSAVP